MQEIKVERNGRERKEGKGNQLNDQLRYPPLPPQQSQGPVLLGSSQRGEFHRHHHHHHHRKLHQAELETDLTAHLLPHPSSPTPSSPCRIVAAKQSSRPLSSSHRRPRCHHHCRRGWHHHPVRRCTWPTPSGACTWSCRPTCSGGTSCGRAPRPRSRPPPRGTATSTCASSRWRRSRLPVLSGSVRAPRCSSPSLAAAHLVGRVGCVGGVSRVSKLSSRADDTTYRQRDSFSAATCTGSLVFFHFFACAGCFYFSSSLRSVCASTAIGPSSCLSI